jgi:hypothetical protein
MVSYGGMASDAVIAEHFPLDHNCDNCYWAKSIGCGFPNKHYYERLCPEEHFCEDWEDPARKLAVGLLKEHMCTTCFWINDPRSSDPCCRLYTGVSLTEFKNP